jgi:hypothetical protein
MPTEPVTRSCEECGFPALEDTSRCPFCRALLAPLPSRGQQQAHLVWRSPLRWLTVAWTALLLGLAVAVAMLAPWPYSLAALLVAAGGLAPAGFLLILEGRSAMRMRAFGHRRAARAPRGQAGDWHATPRPSPPERN